MKATLFSLLLAAFVATSVSAFFLDHNTACKGTIVSCFVAPCRFARCERHPHAVCRDNYCNGCHADFYEGDHKVNCMHSADSS